MKITKSQLKSLIREYINEARDDDWKPTTRSLHKNAVVDELWELIDSAEKNNDADELLKSIKTFFTKVKRGFFDLGFRP